MPRLSRYCPTTMFSTSSVDGLRVSTARGPYIPAPEKFHETDRPRRCCRPECRRRLSVNGTLIWRSPEHWDRCSPDIVFMQIRRSDATSATPLHGLQPVAQRSQSWKARGSPPRLCWPVAHRRGRIDTPSPRRSHPAQARCARLPAVAVEFSKDIRAPGCSPIKISSVFEKSNRHTAKTKIGKTTNGFYSSDAPQNNTLTIGYVAPDHSMMSGLRSQRE